MWIDGAHNRHMGYAVDLKVRDILPLAAQQP